ncbi:hypothetical protein BO71DRAFT_433489 [Aspergillus ellipticus CBS 707.79]|uniref:Uncharacterized protein n=1 Tax=Aspergillus ellipticus CBS 707.79 TaxID=1448320 RepID=A0A319EIM1_9EURO|nr:hypothetical protein BO71DRAFT_433489 [Aspergillus ellipticus CBS 707.79]
MRTRWALGPIQVSETAETAGRLSRSRDSRVTGATALGVGQSQGASQEGSNGLGGRRAGPRQARLLSTNCYHSSSPPPILVITVIVALPRPFVLYHLGECQGSPSVSYTCLSPSFHWLAILEPAVRLLQAPVCRGVGSPESRTALIPPHVLPLRGSLLKDRHLPVALQLDLLVS